jgi:hypothetical protein
VLRLKCKAASGQRSPDLASALRPQKRRDAVLSGNTKPSCGRAQCPYLQHGPVRTSFLKRANVSGFSDVCPYAHRKRADTEHRQNMFTDNSASCACPMATMACARPWPAPVRSSIWKERHRSMPFHAGKACPCMHTGRRTMRMQTWPCTHRRAVAGSNLGLSCSVVWMMWMWMQHGDCSAAPMCEQASSHMRRRMGPAWQPSTRLVQCRFWARQTFPAASAFLSSHP